MHWSDALLDPAHVSLRFPQQGAHTHGLPRETPRYCKVIDACATLIRASRIRDDAVFFESERGNVVMIRHIKVLGFHNRVCCG